MTRDKIEYKTFKIVFVGGGFSAHYASKEANLKFRNGIDPRIYPINIYIKFYFCDNILPG